MEQTSRSGDSKAAVPGGAGGQVKQEIEMEEAGVDGAGLGEPVAAGDGVTTRVEEVTVRIDKAKLHCALCPLPLKPPIFQCDAGHLACGGCGGLLAGDRCYVCNSGGSYGRNPALEDFLRSLIIPCAYHIYGCGAHVAYCDADDHRGECPCAPCSCPERGRGCAFVGSPAMLLGHIAADHPDGGSGTAMVRYGRELSLTLTAARRWHALVGEDDRSLFLVSLAAPCSDDTAVSLVCVRANNGAAAAAAPRYTCRLALELPIGGGEDDGGEVVVMELKVRCSALPGGTPALDQRVFLGLHQRLQAGDTLARRVCIDRLPPGGAAAGAANAATAAGKSTT